MALVDAPCLLSLSLNRLMLLSLNRLNDDGSIENENENDSSLSLNKLKSDFTQPWSIGRGRPTQAQALFSVYSTGHFQFLVTKRHKNRSLLIIDILMCVLDSIARECKARAPFDMILRLYAAGLHLINSDVKSRGGDLTSSGGAKYESVIQILCDDGDILQNLAALLGSLGSYFHISCKENYNNRQTYDLFYLNDLKFLCQPLADLVNSERKQLISENEDAFVTTKL
ncbi:separase [Quercus suber]|uniref:Separase n=1 Tax=Quercus suber TaxID=58331 RepID=A0AAW0K4L8_QUESU